jgi:hypothetical protein
MILRRLAQNLKRQNWTAIWIEFILLVSGVFLGIQVANWNESRKESIQELADLKNLAQDIRSDILEIDETIAISTWRMSVLDALVFKSTGERLPASFTLPFGVVHVPKIPTYTDIDNKSVGLVYVNIRTIDGNRSTYDTIINTGGIRLIKDAKLLEQIQNYYVAVDEIKDTEIYLQANCESAREALHEAGISPVDRKNLAELSEVIARNPKALASSKTVWGSTGNQIKILNDLRQQANALLADIEERKKP